VISIAVGVIVLAKPGNSLKTLAVIAGVLAPIDGVAYVIASLSRGSENRGLAAIIGVISVVVGVLLIRHPIGGVLAAALLIGVWLIVSGVVRLVGAFERDHRAWRIVVALIEIVAGIVIVSSPPISFATLALLVGIAFIVNGVATFALGWFMHSLRGTTASPAIDAGATA
jgi:uncharacterized membrane protein HdeD (DUF308 family)